MHGYNPRVAEPDDRERVARELRRIRGEVRERALLKPEEAKLPDARPTRGPEAVPKEPEPPAPAAAKPPDGAAVNALWEARPTRDAGPLGRWLRRLLAPFFEAQVAFNSRQVQLDNELIAYVEARLAQTHRHYDEVLGIHGRHMAEIDERHLIVQEELVAHVHDLVKRIDLVLQESERGRLSLEFALRDVRNRLAELERRLATG
jgi:hypothetical protein